MSDRQRGSGKGREREREMMNQIEREGQEKKIDGESE